MATRAELERQLADLDERRIELDRLLRGARDRQRFSPDPRAVEQAHADERAIMAELDQVMTRTRAVEAKLLLARRG